MIRLVQIGFFKDEENLLAAGETVDDTKAAL
jgi:hypothetical protein